MNALAPYNLCAGTRRDGLPCSRIVSFEGSYCPNHVFQQITLACDCDGCADYASLLAGPSRLHSRRP